MTDYCIACGDETPETSDGVYVEMKTTRSDISPIYKEMWLCEGCREEREK